MKNEKRAQPAEPAASRKAEHLDEALRQQLVHWRTALGSGASRVGWKIGLNVPEVQQKLGLERSVVGNLTTATLLRPGASHSLAGAQNPKVEPEVAIEVGADGQIAGLAAAIELVDFDRPVDDAYEIVASNVFHRAVAIASSKHDESPEGVTATLSLDGEERESAAADKFDLPAIVALVDETLAGVDESLEVGDRIIAGSLTTPLDVEPGQHVSLDLGPLGSVSIDFTD